MKVLAIILFGYFALEALVGPVLIGKERKPKSAGDYISDLIVCLLTMLMCAYVAGWIK